MNQNPTFDGILAGQPTHEARQYASRNSSWDGIHRHSDGSVIEDDQVDFDAGLPSAPSGLTDEERIAWYAEQENAAVSFSDQHTKLDQPQADTQPKADD
jgi:hypothetical protein